MPTLKAELIRQLVALQAPRSAAERRRLTSYHKTRTVEAIRESLGRMGYVPTAAEVNRHCQFEGL